MKRPNKKEYDFNDLFDSILYSVNMGKYADYLEKKLSTPIDCKKITIKEFLISKGFKTNKDQVTILRMVHLVNEWQEGDNHIKYPIGTKVKICNDLETTIEKVEMFLGSNEYKYWFRDEDNHLKFDFENAIEKM
jgi:hypothetical protein